jgi:hypothetical protein
MITDPRLLELIAAAENLIEHGGSTTNRARLKEALGKVPSDFTDMSFMRELRPTPTVVAVLANAVSMANASNDLYLRAHHLAFALGEVSTVQKL